LGKICPRCGAYIRQKPWKKSNEWTFVDLRCDCDRNALPERKN
jgi:hypothetical protein